jgi:hypothetical protein
MTEPALEMAQHVNGQIDRIVPKHSAVIVHAIDHLLTKLEPKEKRAFAVNLAERVLRG